MTVGERIRTARKIAGFTQAQLAEKSGVASISIHQYETGKRKPRLEQLLLIASALNISMSDLVGLAPEENSDENKVKLDNGLKFLLDIKKSHIFEKCKKRELSIDETVAILMDEPSDEDLLLMAFDRLNDVGRQIAIERVEELGKIKDYQGEFGDEFSAALRVLHPRNRLQTTPPRETLTSTGSKDTTPPEKPTEEPPEGE